MARQCLAEAARTVEPAWSPALRIRLLVARAWIARSEGLNQDASTIWEEGARLLESLGEEGGAAVRLHMNAAVSHMAQDVDAASALSRRVVAAMRQAHMLGFGLYAFAPGKLCEALARKERGTTRKP